MRNFYLSVVGPLGAGKTTAAKAMERNLTGRGFRAGVLPASSIVAEELAQKGITNPVREDFTAHVFARRRECCLEYWAVRFLERAEKLFEDSIVVIDNLRSPFDVKYFQATHPDGISIGIEADEMVCLARIRARGRVIDQLERSDEEILAMMREDNRSGGEVGFDIYSCLKMANYTVDGNQELDQVEAALECILDQVCPILGT